MNLWYFPYVYHTSVFNSYITNILLFLSIITPGQTFEVRVQLILGFSKEVSAHNADDIGVNLQPVKIKHMANHS